MPTSLIQERLRRVVHGALSTIRKEGSHMTEEELLGLMLAAHLGWDGLRILKVASVALEDANYHRECEAVLGLLREAKQTRRQKRSAQ